MKMYPKEFIEWLLCSAKTDMDDNCKYKWVIGTETHVLDYFTTKKAFKYWERNIKKEEKPDRPTFPSDRVINYKYPDDHDIIEDGFGSAWSIKCPECGRKSMQVVRPGKVQCKHCG